MISKNNKKKMQPVDCFFVRNSNYKEAVKEATKMKQDGWSVRNWQYSSLTMTFIILLTRPKGYEAKEDI